MIATPDFTFFNDTAVRHARYSDKRYVVSEAMRRRVGSILLKLLLPKIFCRRNDLPW